MRADAVRASQPCYGSGHVEARPQPAQARRSDLLRAGVRTRSSLHLLVATRALRRALASVGAPQHFLRKSSRGDEHWRAEIDSNVVRGVLPHSVDCRGRVTARELRALEGRSRGLPRGGRGLGDPPAPPLGAQERRTGPASLLERTRPANDRTGSRISTCQRRPSDPGSSERARRSLARSP